MAEEMGAGAAVIEAPAVDTQADNSADESNQSITQEEQGTKGANTAADDKLDGRKQPDPLRKFIADLRRNAEAEVDPARKAELIAHAKSLNDKVGKAGAYEEQFKTVREVREIKALLDTFGAEHNGDWKTGLSTMQSRVTSARQTDQQLEAGDPAVVQKIWDEAPEGVPKIIPALIDKFATEKPAEYQKFIAGHSIKHLDASGFPQAFDAMVKLYESGKTEDAQRLKQELIGWVVGQRQQPAQEQAKADPEVEKLRKEIQTRDETARTAANDVALKSVKEHTLPLLDKAIRQIVGKLGLSNEQVETLKAQAWGDLQDTRNGNQTYKTLTAAKYGSGGPNAWAEYAKTWSNDNAAESARKIAHQYYGHQLKNGAATSKVDPIKQPTAQAVVAGQRPKPSEIDYGPKGMAFARKNGFSNMQDYVLSPKILLKDGTVRISK